MEDGIQILIYIAAFAFSIISAIQKGKKQKPKRKFVPPSQPVPQTVPTAQPVQTDKDRRTEYTKIEKKEKSPLQKQYNERGVSKTFFDRNPYRDSIEYRKRKQKESEKKIKVKTTNKVANDAGLTEIDWKKAVIYSEILRPRF